MALIRHSRRATRALQKLGESDPAFASLSLWCRHQDTETALETPAASEGATILYAPAFEALPLHEQMAVCAHHILHVAFRHGARRAAMARRMGAGFDAALYGLAADALINEALVLSGYAPPRPAPLASELLEEALDERLTPESAVATYDVDKLYRRLARGAPAASSARAVTELVSDGMAEADRADRPRTAERAKAYAEASEYREDVRREPRGAGDREAAQSAAEDEAEWRQRVARAFEAGRQAGRGVGALGFRLADWPEPRTPWETILRRALNKALLATPRRNHRRPLGRWLAADHAARAAGAPSPPYEPAVTRDQRRPRLALALDASQSIDKAGLALFAAQVLGVARRTGAEIHVFVFDEIVHTRHVLRRGAAPAEILSLPLPRGGGTSFVDVMAEAAAIDPSAIILLTDLDGPFGPPPKAPVIWATPDDPPCAPPPFGRVIAIN